MKIKNVIIFIAVICIVGIFIYLNLSTNNISKYSKKLPFTDKEQVMAIFFLGGIENEYDYSIVDKYYHKDDYMEFENIELGGEEYYLIVPRYNKNVTISSLTMTEDGGTDKEIVKDISKPFFLKCNMSDIFSNCEIKLMLNSKEYIYTPYISLKDGSIVTEDFVLLVEK